MLVVDDEPAVLEVLKSTLTNYGYRVLTALHGKEAISICTEKRDEKIQLAIMDMMMPILDGPKAIRALRPLCPDLRFLAVSGLQQNDTIKQLLDQEKIPFLPKPVTTEKLLEALRSAISGAPASARGA